MSALLAALAGTFVATGIVVFGGSSLLGGAMSGSGGTRRERLGRRR